MQERYFDDAESRDWMLDVHAKCLTEDQRALVRKCTSAFVLYGNEDAPDGVDIYSTNSPLNGDMPMFILRQDLEGDLRLTHINGVKQ